MMVMDTKKIFLVLGCGNFGQKAIAKISKIKPRPQIIAIDREGRKLSPISSGVDEIYEGDAVNYLTKTAAVISADTWIIPSLPLHLAYEWLVANLKIKGRTVQKIPVPKSLDLGLPSQFWSEKGTLYASYADFRCPDDCPEPAEYCTVTGLPREKPLYELISRVDIKDYSILTIQSRQIAPGLGGYQLSTLENTERILLKNTGFFIISTSCKCHAVIDALYLARN